MTTNNTQYKKEFSAGGVVFKRQEGQMLWLIQERAGHGYWQLPKGHIEKGETPVTAALREVEEESGITGRILTKLTPSTYFYTIDGEKRLKQVTWFLMEYVSGSTDNFQPEEVSQAEFVLFDVASNRIAYESEKLVLKQANDMVKTGDFPSSSVA